MPLLDQPAPLGVGYRLETIVGAELQVDAVEVVAERLGGNPQLAGDGLGVVPLGEELQDAPLLFGKRLDLGVLRFIARRLIGTIPVLFGLSIIVSLVTEPKPAGSLRGLVYSETPREELVDPEEAKQPWFRRTLPLAGISLAMVIALNFLV